MSVAPARPPWARLRLAVVGLGELGGACARAALGAADLTLAAVARRPASRDRALPAGFPTGVAACEVGALRDVDAVLVCVPPERVLDTARQLLSRKLPVVECAQLHALAFREHRDAIHHEALRQRCAAVVGAGWDPGALPLLRGWLALLVPKGRTEVRLHAAASLHHTSAARGVAGVRDALCTERRGADGVLHRYVYVELEPGADAERIGTRLRSDPLFLGEETQVLPVESLAALEAEGEGVLLERWGEAGAKAHQRLLIEARCDPPALAAQVMLATARAVPFLPPGAHSLLDIPRRSSSATPRPPRATRARERQR
jgi:diaminopimelate dehydrogenase